MAQDKSRFSTLIERADGKDFPFYNGKPYSFSGQQWWLIFGSVILAFIVLSGYKYVLPGQWSRTAAGILVAVVPLAVMHYIKPGSWRKLFSKIRPSDVLLMIGCAALTLVVTILVNHVVHAVFGSSANPAAGALSGGDALAKALFLGGAFVSLIGEEIFTILPFLGLLYYFYQKQGMSRKRAIILAYLLSAIFFGAAHLQTYNWNIAQAIVTISVARLVLSLAYIRTKNLWVSAGAHIMVDFSIFLSVIFSGVKL